MGRDEHRDPLEERAIVVTGAVDDEIEVFVRASRLGRTSVTFSFEAYRVADDVLMVTAHQTLVYVDLAERRACPVPEEYRAAVIELEGDDVER